MPEPDDHPTSLPKGPLRDCLERVRAEIVSEMNNAQHPSRHCAGDASIAVAQLQHWMNRLTEAIHFNGQVPEAISRVQNDGPAWPDLDNAMRALTYINGTPGHAKHAFELLGKHRHKMYTHLIKAADLLERFSDRIILTFDVEDAQRRVKDAYRIIIHDVLGLR